MSNSSIMSIGEMIDSAFGESDVNVVNFKLIQAVLYLLARQLRILERKVAVEIAIHGVRSRTNLSVTEVKIRATVSKKKKRKGAETESEEDKKTTKQAIKTTKSRPSTIQQGDDISSQEKSSTMKSSSDKTTSELTKTSTTDKTSSDKTKTSSDKTSSDVTKTSTVITTSDKSKSTTDKTSSDKTKSSTDKTSTDITKSSTDKTSSEKTKSSTDRTSSDKTKTSTDKTSTDKTTSSSKKSSSAKDTSDKSSSDQYKKKDLRSLLNLIEEQREKELRVIHQRADSREVADKTPSAMLSLDSVEEQYEKLLVVERVPTERRKSSIGKRTPQLSIVTQDQFETLANVVRDLQSRFADTGAADFPENVQLMQDLRKGASLTDAMAALQLSARLDAAEKTLKQMLELVTDLASKTGLEIELTSRGVPEDKGVSHLGTTTSKSLHSQSKKSVASKKSKATSKADMQPKPSTHLPIETADSSMPSSEPSKIDIAPTPSSMPGQEEDQSEKIIIPVDYVTYEELDKELQDISDGLLKTLNSLTAESNANAENAIKIAKRLEDKLEESLNLGSRMNDLELLISAFSEKINVLDTGLSSQMTNYQEQLTQMQHDLEAGLEAMAEALANTGGDTVAVTELNTNFTNLQIDVENTNTRQKDLLESQNGLSKDLTALWEQIEMLRELKSDRDEVADALRDKAGIGALNGLVTLQQFNAVRGDFEKRIGAAYDKFNNQEISWQKAIDDLFKELHDKADWLQLVALRDDVNRNLEMLRSRIHEMLEIVGEPRTAAITRKLYRDDACLSCSSPAHMDLEELNVVPKLPAFPGPIRPPTIGAEDLSKPAEHGDHRPCIPGLPIPHTRDPRSHICHRYCGGSHTVVMDKKSRTPAGMIITSVGRPFTSAIGSDGKVYMVDESMIAKRPCVPCNSNKITTPEPSQAEPVTEKQENDSDMTPLDFMSGLCSADEPKELSVTPPPPSEDI